MHHEWWPLAGWCALAPAARAAALGLAAFFLCRVGMGAVHKGLVATFARRRSAGATPLV